ncbi:hypothetical protein WM40_07835 [Robbsia andropogonis]|uniref:Uncharacterized protein n=1 Tax=Robbsia andropogonis TaxID=28092 RepID=A0A0F5K1J5_9BURK|nr:hypothetical protein WM40_07835 [Robbsia andropogonis]
MSGADRWRRRDRTQADDGWLIAPRWFRHARPGTNDAFPWTGYAFSEIAGIGTIWMVDRARQAALTVGHPRPSATTATAGGCLCLLDRRRASA